MDRDNEGIPCAGGRLSPAAENAAREDTRPPGEFTPINNVQHNKMDEFVTISATVLEMSGRTIENLRIVDIRLTPEEEEEREKEEREKEKRRDKDGDDDDD